MAAINQRIPNFLGGVSQQPDFIKFPGQLRSCDNAVPDVTFGLMKRPPAEYVNKLTNTTSTGQWFEILNKEGEKFIVQITPANYASTPIRVWNLTTGVEVNVTEGSGNAYDYLNGAGTLGKHTIQDYTYITNPNTTVGTTGTTSTYNSGNKYAFIKIDTLAYNTEYSVFLGGATDAIPTPGTKNRATALKVYRYSGPDVGKNSWNDLDPEAELSGQADFFGNNGGSGTGNTGSMTGVRGTVTVNGQPFFKSQSPQYDGTGTLAEDFLGYTQDYDIRFTANVSMKDGGTDVTNGAKSHVIIPKASTGVGVEYTVEVVGVKAYDTYAGVTNVATYRTPKNPDDGSLSMGSVITKLSAEINSKYSSSGFTAEVVGNGILIKRSNTTAFKAHVMGGMANEALSVFQDSAQDISKLPSECAHGYLVEVANTEESDSDNYWLTFKADNGQDGSGVWEETVAPGITAGLDKDTLPHALVAVRSGGNIASFQFCKLGGSGTNPNNLEWDIRQVGDLETNPDPSFVSKKISQIFFYRNRLGFIADEQIVMSQPSSYHNFFAVSAITSSDDNPVDISVSDVKPAYINHVLPTQKGVLMFSDAGQFMLFSEQDSFSPKTARLKKVAGYECSTTIKPLDMGTTYMFANHTGAYSRAFEIAIVDESVPPKIIDQTRVVPSFLPKTLNVNSGSADLGLVTFGINNSTYHNTNFNTSTIYNYKYFDSGDQREQSAWYTWTLTGVLRHCFYTGGAFYTVTLQDNSEVILSRYEYLSDDNGMSDRRYTIGDTSQTVGEGEAGLRVNRSLEAALDNLVMYKQSDGANTTTGVSVALSGTNTVITVPYTIDQTYSPQIVVISGTESGVVKAPDSVSGTTMTFNNLDMRTWHMAIGYKYTTEFELPQYYFSYDQGKYDIDGDLRMGGYNFELGLSGPVSFTVDDVIGNANLYTQNESGMLTDWSTFQEIPSLLYKSIRVPIYRKNDKFRFKVKIDQPFSATIVSASWDGRYNTRRHVRK
tara:strand:+ start:2273 stop:5269 length:2997 start_codon:yes stop_codon:yes gene_type:complete